MDRKDEEYSKSSKMPFHLTFENMQEIYFALSELMQNNEDDTTKNEATWRRLDAY